MVARQVKILQPSREGSDFTLGLSGGAAHRLVADAASGAASELITAPLTPAPLINNVALFIDQNLQQLDGVPPARLTLQSLYGTRNTLLLNATSPAPSCLS